MTSRSEYVSEHIGRPVAEVYAFVTDASHLPRWAPGLGTSVEHNGGVWYVDTPGGRMRLDFAPANDLGVLDHYLTAASGEVVYVPMRVTADDDGSEVVLTVRRRPGMTDAEFRADADAVAADLAALKRLLEADR
jgi:uncharacterized protein YndB with AHSA1/START domain